MVSPLDVWQWQSAVNIQPSLLGTEVLCIALEHSKNNIIEERILMIVGTPKFFFWKWNAIQCCLVWFAKAKWRTECKIRGKVSLLLHYWSNFALSQPCSIIQKVHRGSTQDAIVGSCWGRIQLLGFFICICTNMMMKIPCQDY